MYRMFRMNSLYQLDVPGTGTQTAKQVAAEGFTKPAAQTATPAKLAPAAAVTNTGTEMASSPVVIPSAQESAVIEQQFTLTSDIAAINLARGTSATVKINAAATASLGVATLPANAPLNVSLSSDSELTVSAPANSPSGNYKIVVTGTRQSTTKTVSIGVKIS